MSPANVPSGRIFILTGWGNPQPASCHHAHAWASNRAQALLIAGRNLGLRPPRPACLEWKSCPSVPGERKLAPERPQKAGSKFRISYNPLPIAERVAISYPYPLIDQTPDATPSAHPSAVPDNRSTIAPFRHVHSRRPREHKPPERNHDPCAPMLARSHPDATSRTHSGEWKPWNGIRAPSSRRLNNPTVAGPHSRYFLTLDLLRF